MVLSMLPSATARGIGNAMFIGQSLADIHHDIKDKNYTSAGLNTAFTFAPYGINRIYKSWKPAKRLSDIINKNILIVVQVKLEVHLKKLMSSSYKIKCLIQRRPILMLYLNIEI